MKRFVLSLFLASIFLYVPGAYAHAFTTTGCGEDCAKCHTLSKDETNSILTQMKVPQAKILEIKMSPVRSLWEITIDNKGEKGLFYVDFSKKYVVLGNILEVASGVNKTAERAEEIQEVKKVDLASIPLEDSLIMGNPQAARKIFVFTDPDCPFCGRLHATIKQILEKRQDIVFYVKLYPLPMHKDAGWKAKSIMCNNSLQMLEDNFNKKTIPKTECDTKAIENNLKLVEKLGISGTPTLVFPDGSVQVGALPSERILQLLDKPKP